MIHELCIGITDQFAIVESDFTNFTFRYLRKVLILKFKWFEGARIVTYNADEDLACDTMTAWIMISSVLSFLYIWISVFRICE